MVVAFQTSRLEKDGRSLVLFASQDRHKTPERRLETCAVLVFVDTLHHRLFCGVYFQHSLTHQMKVSQN
jgi:hypothetical protein